MVDLSDVSSVCVDAEVSRYGGEKHIVALKFKAGFSISLTEVATSDSKTYDVIQVAIYKYTCRTRTLFFRFHEEVASRVRKFLQLPASSIKNPRGGQVSNDNDTSAADDEDKSATHMDPVEAQSKQTEERPEAEVVPGSTAKSEAKFGQDRELEESLQTGTASSSSSEDGFEKIEGCDVPCDEANVDSPADR